MLEKKYSKGMVFGVFDGVHPGHTYFLSQASKKCHELIVIVTQNEVVELLKKYTPKFSHDERTHQIKSFDAGFIVEPGDLRMGEWDIIKKHKPDVVILGYDQQGIEKEMTRIGMPYIIIDAFFPDKYKSSIINRK